MFALIVVLSLVTGGLSSILCPTKVDPQVTVHLPHPTSCSKFLTCVGNHPVEQDCPAGLHWNVEQSFCDYPRSSVCARGQLEPRPFNSTAVANSVCLPQTSHCPLNSNPSERVIFLKHRDCRKFYACVSTQQVELSCPPNLYWNSRGCVCDYEVDAECEQTDRPDDEVPAETDVEDQQPADGAEESVDDTEQEPAAPEDAEDQEPVEDSADDVAEEPVEPEAAEDQEPAEESDPTVDEQPQESDAIVRVRRAADDSSSSSGSSGSSSGSDTSGSDTSGSGSSSSGSSGTGSSSSGTGSTGSTAQSGAEIRAVSSIAVIAFTAAMSVL